MGKQRRPTEHLPAVRADEERGHAVDAGLGNAALQAQLAGGEVGLEVVRDVAFPMVERAILALQLEPRGEATDRFVEIIERSHLSDERRALLTDRLQTDEAAAMGVRDAVERWFGADGPEVRDAVIDALDAVWQGLEQGIGDQATGQWRFGGAEVGLSEGAISGPVAARAESLVADLAATLGAAALAAHVGGRAGESVRGFCRDVLLALVWDEEEEEEEGLEPGAYAEES